MVKNTVVAIAILGAVLAGALAKASPASTAPGFYRVAERDGVWWFMDPAGKPVLSAGVDAIRDCPDRIRGTGPCPYLQAVEKIYPSHDAWVRATLKRLRAWGFNTIGAWSERDLWDRGLPYTVNLDIAARAGADWQHGKVVDVYAPRFKRTALRVALQLCAPRKNDPDLLGYFSDNELRWGPDWRGKENMLAMYLEMPPGAPGRQAAVRFLRERYSGDIQKLNRAWGVKAGDFDSVPFEGTTAAYGADASQFLAEMAQRYFTICAQAIHAADPNHLYLGARFAGRPPAPVVRAARAADVVSINIYSFDPRPLVNYVYRLTHRPVLVTEFAFRATDSGLPNTKGAGPKVPNEKARASAYANFVTRLESLPGAVGYHWFQWSDEPKEGRFDGENSNYGFVTNGDKPYAAFVRGVKAANRAALCIHEGLSTR
jgi:hypothetical protein